MTNSRMWFVVPFLAGAMWAVTIEAQPAQKYKPYTNQWEMRLAQAQGAALFQADGTHQCQSKTSVGHTCKVSGTEFSSCNNAYYALKQNDCCPRTKDGGDSIGFTLDSCKKFMK